MAAPAATAARSARSARSAPSGSAPNPLRAGDAVDPGPKSFQSPFKISVEMLSPDADEEADTDYYDAIDVKKQWSISQERRDSRSDVEQHHQPQLQLQQKPRPQLQRQQKAAARSDASTTSRDETFGSYTGDDASRTMIDDGIERTLTGLQSAASSVADFFQTLTTDVRKLPRHNLLDIRGMNCAGRKQTVECNDGSFPARSSVNFPLHASVKCGIGSDDPVSHLSSYAYNIKNRVPTGAPPDALKPSTRHFATLFYGRHDDYDSATDDDSASMNTIEIMQREEEEQIRRLGSWNTLDSSEQAPPSAPVLNLDTINCAYAADVPLPTTHDGYLNMPEEILPPLPITPSPTSVRYKRPLPPPSLSSRTSNPQGKAVSTVDSSSLMLKNAQHSQSSSSVTIQVPRSDSSASSSQKSVTFAYPPIKSLKAVPRVPVEDLPNLFFTSRELSQIETDRWSTKGTEDVETIAVLASDHPAPKLRKQKRRLVTQVQIYLRSSTKTPVRRHQTTEV